MNPEMLTVSGPYEAFATEDGCKAEVRKGNTVVKKFSGETAWSDSVREAEDLNSLR